MIDFISIESRIFVFTLTYKNDMKLQHDIDNDRMKI